MKYFIIAFFSIFQLFAQQKTMLITRENTSKQIKIKEGRRVRIKTFDGKRISGKLKTIDDQTIMIKGKQLKLSKIEKIKRNPLAMILPLSIVTGIYGTSIVLIGVAIAVVIDNDAGIAPLITLLTIGAGLIYTAIKPPNILKGYNHFKGWEYTIIKP